MKILWLKNELLHPVDKGGRIRTYEMLKRLKEAHEITYVCLTSAQDSAEAFERASEYCDRLVTAPWQAPLKYSTRFYTDLALNLVSPLPYVLQKYRSSAMRHLILQELSQWSPDVVVSDFLTPTPNMPGRLSRPSVLFQHNVESMLWQRYVDNEANPVKKAYFQSQLWKMLRYERATCRRFDAVVAVSKNDQAFFRDRFGVSEVYDVPTGVDTEYFRPQGAEPDPYSIVFSGSMDWLPNEDAIAFFAERVLPLVLHKVPQATLTAVGRNPTPRLMELARQNPRIKLTGWVSDVRPYIEKASAYVVPICVGGGTRIKIYEAMAMAKPVVSTTIGAEGLPVQDGKDLIIADRPEDFAAAVIRVLKEPEVASQLGAQARQTVCEHFGWDRAAGQFAAVCQHVIERGARAS